MVANQAAAFLRRVLRSSREPCGLLLRFSCIRLFIKEEDIKNRLWILIPLLVTAFSLQGCFESLRGSGRVITDVRRISSDFKGVRLTNHGDLIVSLGDRVELTVEGDDNILPHIITRVSNDTLLIGNNPDLRGGWSSRRGVRYLLTVRQGQLNRLELTSHGDAQLPELSGPGAAVRLSSHGDIRIDRVETDDFTLNLTSHGDVTIGELISDGIVARLTSHGRVRLQSGKVREQDVSMTSHGDYLAGQLPCDHCRVRNSSHGTVRVWAEKTLNARLTSHGRLYYRGDPKIDASRESRKKMRPLD
ncbi:MAG TPA: DUF2807 domain-containing protein [Candidatus Aminicenantes bacterium]|nr:DUF2807 domain-containing protein [Candidatus Aminicenantes bacterium]